MLMDASSSRVASGLQSDFVQALGRVSTVDVPVVLECGVGVIALMPVGEKHLLLRRYNVRPGLLLNWRKTWPDAPTPRYWTLVPLSAQRPFFVRSWQHGG